MSYSVASDPLLLSLPESSPLAPRRSTRTDDDRPPYCPTCHRRLVILTTHIDRPASDGGQRLRYQLWGCPRGHSTSRRIMGSFSPVEVLPDPLTQDDDYRLGGSSHRISTGPDDRELR